MGYDFHAHCYPLTWEDKIYLPERNRIGFFTNLNKVEGDLVYLDYKLTEPLLCPFHKEKGENIQMFWTKKNDRPAWLVSIQKGYSSFEFCFGLLATVIFTSAFGLLIVLIMT